VRIIPTTPSLPFFSILYCDAESSSQDKVQMVTAAGLIVQRDDRAIHDNADTGRAAANVDDCSLRELKQCLRCGDLIDQITASDSGIFQNVTTCPGFGCRYSGRKRGCGCGNLLLQSAGCRGLKLRDGSNRVAKIHNDAVANRLAWKAVPVDRSPLPVYGRQNYRCSSEIYSER
jgi:hypothetical protein